MTIPFRLSRRDFLKISLSTLAMILPGSGCTSSPTEIPFEETRGGWEKYKFNPVLGGDYGTCFDVSVLKQDDQYRMWFSWRPQKSIALVESNDGINWSIPTIVLDPETDTGWEDQVNRPSVIKIGDVYHMWYTGQIRKHSSIGHAISGDGVHWQRSSANPVLRADIPWEKKAVMCPNVIYDDINSQYRLWYSGGEQYEPDAIGYAISEDGINWQKHPDNPIFGANSINSWERKKVTGSYIVHQNEYHYMFYIGFSSNSLARIGLARSKDGITGWERHPENPIISPGIGKWDSDSVYKPSVIFDGEQWLLWYNGRGNSKEQIGLAFKFGSSLRF